jgi:hypothetical protein
MGIGITMAMARYPGGFDWVYTVISRLGSREHNPAGAPWLTGSLLATMVLLWPVTTRLATAAARAGSRSRVPVIALRVGLVGGALLALEGLLAVDLTRVGRKAHEVLALATFLGLYGGVVGLSIQRLRHDRASLLPAVVVVLPLMAVGVSQLALYLDQRDLGWVNTEWREMGIPFWFSFAFWQWLAVAFLGLGLGLLTLSEVEVEVEVEVAKSKSKSKSVSS